MRLQNALLYTFFFSLNFEVWDPFSTGGNFSVAKLTGLLYALSLVPKLKYILYFPLILKTYAKLLISFYLLIVVMSFINLNHYSSDFLQMSLIQNVTLFFILFNHERLCPGIIEKSFVSFWIGSLILASCFYLGIGIETNIEGRVTLFGDNENIIGIRMVVSALFIAHILIQVKKKLPKLIYLILTLSFIPLITLTLNTGSRLSFISLFFGISLIFIMYKKRELLSKGLILGIGILASTSIFDLAMRSNVLGTRLSRTIQEGNLAGREEIWYSILPLLKENWIFGVGRTGYIEYITELFGRIKSPHNVIIEVLAYSGVIGLLLFLGVLKKSFASAYKYYKSYNEVAPFVFFVPILGIILSAQLLTFKLAWVILAYAATRSLYLKR